MNSKEENSQDFSKEENFCPNYVQEFGLWTILCVDSHTAVTFSATMMVEELVLPPRIRGMTEASITRRPPQCSYLFDHHDGGGVGVASRYPRHDRGGNYTPTPAL